MISLLSSVNLSEFDTLIYSPQHLVSELQGARQQTSLEYVYGAIARLEELSEWVTTGHSLVVLVTSLPLLNIQGLSQSRLLEGSFPLNLSAYQEASGRRIEYCGPKELEPLLSLFSAGLRYETVLLSEDIKPLFRVVQARPGVQQNIGGYFHHGEGVVLLVPPLQQGDAKRQTSYLDTMVGLPERIRNLGEVEYPVWIENIWTRPESEAHKAVTATIAQIASLNNTIAERKLKIFDEMKSKELLFTTGDQFCGAVIAALTELGMRVVGGPHPRADILGLEGSVVAAIEAKGLEGSSKERDLRQVETWKSEVLHTLSSLPSERDATLRNYASKLADLGLDVDGEHECECKGIMVIGTFRLTPVPDRNEGDSFPGDIKNKIKLARVCALTGLQLYNLLMAARNGLEEKTTIRALLLRTEGVLEDHNDWQKYLNRAT
ncbi:MAG: hypothetical protein WAU57_11925 [Xanthobacteraceae bacterium]